jgi:hypothetical protein
MLLRTALTAGVAGFVAFSFLPQARAASEYYAGKSNEPANGIYVGAAIGQSRFDDSFSSDDLDRNDKSCDLDMISLGLTYSFPLPK